MVKWRSKSCPRCGGDMFIDRDLDSWYEQCLQCSYRIEMKPMAKVKESVLAGGTRGKKPIEPEEEV